MATEPAESIRGKAWAIYNAEIKRLVEPEHNGKYLVLNVETGYYELTSGWEWRTSECWKSTNIPRVQSRRTSRSASAIPPLSIAHRRSRYGIPGVSPPGV